MIDSGGQITFNSPFLESDILTGDVTVNGEWKEVTPVNINFRGTLENNATVWNANIGIHTFSGSGFNIKGDTETVIQNLVISGVTINLNDLRCENLTVNASLTNNGSIVVINSLDGSNTLTNNTSLYIRANPITIANIFAQSTSNVVIYDGTNQTIKIGDYENLYLMGSGIKTISSGINIGNSFEVSSGVSVDIIGTSSASFLKFNNITQKVGTWGATGSGALFIDDTYLTGSGKINVTDTTVLPTLAIALSDNALTTGETSIVTFTFSEVPASFSNANITVTNGSGSLSNVVVDPLNPLVYTAVFAPNSNKNISTNVISVDTSWTDTATSLNHPSGISTSPNYSVYTIISSGGGSGGYSLNTKTSLSTGIATAITQTTANLNGSIISTGGVNSSARGFEYGLTINYGTPVLDSGNFGTGAYIKNISSLVCGTTYHYRSFAINSIGTGYGNDQVFTTDLCPTLNIPDNSKVNSSLNNSSITIRSLKLGMTGDDVKALQVYLNTHGYVLTTTGPRSPGNETTYFGTDTQNAVILFQKDNGLNQDGVVGKRTREIMAKL